MKFLCLLLTTWGASGEPGGEDFWDVAVPFFFSSCRIVFVAFVYLGGSGSGGWGVHLSCFGGSF